jgi:molybdopterin-guanine dinucleotide biosynthesis protein A
VKINRLTGIVLAGGRSYRMGVDKGLIEFGGRKLVEYSLNLLGQYCTELIISSNNPDYQQFGFPVVLDEKTGRGPLAGLVEALKISSGEWSIVLPCDMPFINRQLIDLLLEKRDHFKGVVPVHGEFMEPLTAVYHSEMLVAFSGALLRDELSLHAVIRNSEIGLIPVDDLLLEFPLLFSNFNYPEDFKSVKNRL